jgi:hypothetical protein
MSRLIDETAKGIAIEVMIPSRQLSVMVRDRWTERARHLGREVCISDGEWSRA